MTSSVSPAPRRAPVSRGWPAGSYGRKRLFAAALLTLGAASIHFSVVPAHLAEYPLFGIFFLVLGAAQVVLALATVLRPGRRLFAGAALGTLAVLALWTLSRTAGLPVGPDAWQPEDAGVPDMIADAFEALSVLLFASLALRPPRAWARRPGRVRSVLAALALLPVLVLLLTLTAAGALAGANAMPAAMNMSPPAPDGPTTSLTRLVEPPGPQPVKSFTLTAEPGQVAGFAVWTYNGTVPGPELRVTQGDRVRVTLVNHLPAATSIHWHGVRVPNAEDGVAGVTQDAVPPGGTYTYEFVVKDPGTYWYHSHQDALQQIPLGLYGALVVVPPQGPHYDRDYAVAFGDLGPGEPEIVANGTPGGVHLVARPGELVRLRLINAALIDMPGSPEQVALVGAPYAVVARDGHDLHAPGELGPAILPVGTAQRYDLVFRMPATGQVRLVYAGPETQAAAEAPANQDQSPLAQLGRGIANLIFGPPKIRHGELVILGAGAIPALPAVSGLPTFDLTTYGAPAPDPVADRATFDVSADLHLQTSPGFRDGAFQNIQLVNGAASPHTAPILVHEGQVVRLRFVNDTDEYHPMHLHGHIFSVLSKDGRRLTGSPVHLDSLLVGPHETWEVAFLADNPGLWMLHCHVLIHAAYGLSLMVDYAGISTPYTMGTRAGNFPE